MSVAENSAAVERARKAWNAGDLDSYLQQVDMLGWLVQLGAMPSPA